MPAAEHHEDPLLSDPYQKDSILINYCCHTVNSSDIATILHSILRAFDKGRGNAEKLLVKTGQQVDTDFMQDLVEYTQSLITTSSSINRILYQLETTSKTDMIALMIGKYKELAAKVDPQVRQAVRDSIQIRKSEDLVMIHMPYLPSRKQTDRQFIFDLLFQRLIDEGPYPQWSRVHILFTHVYPAMLRTMPKDVDNFVYKPAIDFLSAAMSFSDSAWTCSLEQRAEFRDDLETGVYIQVTPMSWRSTLDAWQELPTSQVSSTDCQRRPASELCPNSSDPKP